MLSLASASLSFAPGYVPSHATTPRAAVSLGLFDGVKDAFGSSGAEKPLVSADRVTPFDRWMGLDKALVDAETPDESAAYIDPTDKASYFTVALPKPMGIAFVENDKDCGGVYVDEVLAEGSAQTSNAPLLKGDQLVGVDTLAVIGADFDQAIDAIKQTSGDTTKLTFFRGPTAFLYGPTAPSDDWYAEFLKSV